MTPEQFETKFQELLKSAPEGTTLFVTYFNKGQKRPIICGLQGKPIDITVGLSMFASRDERVAEILTVASIAIQNK